MVTGWVRACFSRDLFRERAIPARHDGPSRPIYGAWWIGRSAVGAEERVWYRREGEAIKSEARATREKARRVLQAAAVEAYGRPGAYVTRDPVMRRAGILDVEEFRAIAEYLEEKGYIAEADEGYGIFVVTAAGVEEAMS